ncbi:hypothetical protein AKJ49_00120 [candidate division MSBL1 archaeon SCGC-AAA382A03]|uniref:Aldehyde dehydrogenase domain-containing protein n=1 Tax=candidate division MSBL1 archaeon SCGC-AAA382A03 TaxID=1698278 RepID=A0A133VH55_9EURY|nr:hypothetical protein AKJ49_00120 [candidate division MSBL1 archaeon SCGC-AAA382A03]
MFVDGEWTGAESGETFDVTSPATGEVIAKVPKGGKKDAEKAIKAAEKAQEKLAEKTTKEKERLWRVTIEKLEPNLEDYAKEMSLEQGKPITEAKEEVYEVADNILWAVEDVKHLETEVLNGYLQPDRKYIVQREPLGVVGIITPWNYPMVMPAEFIPHAILCGNSVVYKPASNTPIGGIRFIEGMVEAIEELDFPKEIINIVTGPGSEVGSEISSNPSVGGICLVGEVTTGQKIVESAGLKKVTLELGGNDPLIVMDDADLEKAANDTVYGCCGNAGQVCCANERILVHEDIHDEFVDMVVEKTKNVKLGDPLDEDTGIGPMNNEDTLQKVEKHVEDAKEKGANILCGCKRASGFPTDLYYEPGVIGDVTTDMLLNKEETFGPVAPIITFSSKEEALEIANNQPYGLSSAVHTTNLDNAMYFSDKIQAGNVIVNGPVLTWDLLHPWSGMKKSGIGATGGKWSVEAFTTIKEIQLPWKQ